MIICNPESSTLNTWRRWNSPQPWPMREVIHKDGRITRRLPCAHYTDPALDWRCSEPAWRVALCTFISHLPHNISYPASLLHIILSQSCSRWYAALRLDLLVVPFVRIDWSCIDVEEQVDKCVSFGEIIPATPANSRYPTMLAIRSTPLPRLCSLQFHLTRLKVVIRRDGCWHISSWEDDDACRNLLTQAGKRPILLAPIRRHKRRLFFESSTRGTTLTYVATLCCLHTICKWARSWEPWFVAISQRIYYASSFIYQVGSWRSVIGSRSTQQVKHLIRRNLPKRPVLCLWKAPQHGIPITIWSSKIAV